MSQSSRHAAQRYCAQGRYSRFGFQSADRYGVVPPLPEWVPYFQVRPLHAYVPELRGPFVYAEPFQRV